MFIAASISSRGAGKDLIARALAGHVDAYISSDVLAETERNLAEKAPEALSTFYNYRDSLSSKIVNPSRETVKEVAQSVAGKDAPIVAAAFEANAVYLATYDQKHLLGQREQIWDKFGVMVLTPVEVLYLLPAEVEEVLEPEEEG